MTTKALLATHQLREKTSKQLHQVLGKKKKESIWKHGNAWVVLPPLFPPLEKTRSGVGIFSNASPRAKLPWDPMNLQTVVTKTGPGHALYMWFIQKIHSGGGTQLYCLWGLISLWLSWIVVLSHLCEHPVNTKPFQPSSFRTPKQLWYFVEVVD